MTQDNSLSNYNEVGGVIYSIGEAEDKGKKKSFYVRKFVLEIKSSYKGNSYSKFAEFELKSDDYIKLIDNYNVGDPVVVTYTLDGRPWTPKDGNEMIFNSLRAIRISQMPSELQDKKKEKEGDIPGLLDDKHLLDNLKDKAFEDDPFKEDDDTSDLPFMLTIPLAIGTLMQFMIF